LGNKKIQLKDILNQNWIKFGPRNLERQREWKDKLSAMTQIKPEIGQWNAKD
jgi:hypothetical protein